TNAVACASEAARSRPLTGTDDQREELLGDALIGGPDTLSASRKIALLRDPMTLSRLHFQVWTSPLAHPAWAAARAARGVTVPVSTTPQAPVTEPHAPLRATPLGGGTGSMRPVH